MQFGGYYYWILILALNVRIINIIKHSKYEKYNRKCTSDREISLLKLKYRPKRYSSWHLFLKHCRGRLFAIPIRSLDLVKYNRVRIKNEKKLK